MSSMSPIVMILIGVLVIVRVVGKQVVGSAVTTRSLVLMPAILVVLGIISISSALPSASAGELGFFTLDVVVLVVLGIARGASTQLSIRDGGLYQKGSALTLVLWLGTIALRIGAGFLAARLGVGGGLTTASVLLTFGLSIAMQNATVWLRAQQRNLPLAMVPVRR